MYLLGCFLRRTLCCATEHKKTGPTRHQHQHGRSEAADAIMLNKAFAAVRRSMDIIKVLPAVHPARVQHELPALLVLNYVAETAAARLFTRGAASAQQLLLAHVRAALALQQARLFPGQLVRVVKNVNVSYR